MKLQVSNKIKSLAFRRMHSSITNLALLLPLWLTLKACHNSQDSGTYNQLGSESQFQSVPVEGHFTFMIQNTTLESNIGNSFTMWAKPQDPSKSLTEVLFGMIIKDQLTLVDRNIILEPNQTSHNPKAYVEIPSFSEEGSWMRFDLGSVIKEENDLPRWDLENNRGFSLAFTESQDPALNNKIIIVLPQPGESSPEPTEARTDIDPSSLESDPLCKQNNTLCQEVSVIMGCSDVDFSCEPPPLASEESNIIITDFGSLKKTSSDTFETTSKSEVIQIGFPITDNQESFCEKNTYYIPTSPHDGTRNNRCKIEPLESNLEFQNDEFYICSIKVTLEEPSNLKEHYCDIRIIQPAEPKLIKTIRVVKPF